MTRAATVKIMKRKKSVGLWTKAKENGPSGGNTNVEASRSFSCS